jgi:hypothetical protein
MLFCSTDYFGEVDFYCCLNCLVMREYEARDFDEYCSDWVKDFEESMSGAFRAFFAPAVSDPRIMLVPGGQTVGFHHIIRSIAQGLGM